MSQDPRGDRAWELVRKSLRDDPPSRILVLCREHLGDLVNTTPGLRAIRELFHGARITAEVGEGPARILDGCPWFDELWLRPNHQGGAGKLAAVRRMRAGSFDLSINLDDSNDMVLHAWLGGIRRRVGIWRGKKFARLYSACVPHLLDGHELRDNIESLVKRLGCTSFDPAPNLFPSPLDETSAHEALQRAGVPEHGYVCIHPGASEARKCWPPAWYGSVADALLKKGFAVAVTGGKGDTQVAESMRQASALPVPALSSDLTPLQLACVLRRAKVVIAGDTGPIHVAAAMGTRVIALFGPTSPKLCGPYGSGHIILTSPSGDMNGISVESVVLASARAMEEQ